MAKETSTEGIGGALTKQDSIEVTKNAKGDASWKIKLYYDIEEENPAEVVKALVKIDKDLASRFK